ncbi:hypothetical protein MKX01_000831 [Papaver californicum]|nr:hypothetical protein MKX01_000831 [Papaver californicum]
MKLIISGDSVILTRMLLLVVFSITSTNANVEGDALYALRRGVKYPGNVLQSWDPTLVNPCTWFHVTCDKDNRVIRLDLGNTKLYGNLVPELAKRLNGNRLTGRIPRDLTKFGNLKSLDVSNNDLCGTIPTSGSFTKLQRRGEIHEFIHPIPIPIISFIILVFENNPRLEGPELMGFVRYDVGNCN